ncbi:MAG: hypothetical protein ABIR16_03270 [Dokdonella sp.]
MPLINRFSAIPFFACLASGTVWAEKVKPPTIILGEPTTNIVVAEYKEAGPYNRIVFSKVRVLKSRDDVPALIDIAKPDLRKPLVAGQSYVIAYTPYAEDRFERIGVNPRGANFISSPGLEPALFADTPDNEALLMWRIDEDEDGEAEEEGERDSPAAEAAMPKLLQMLASTDSQRRAFAAAEIAYRAKLVAALDAAQQKALQRFVIDDAGPDGSRALILAAAAAMPAKSVAVRGWNDLAVDLLENSALTDSTEAGRSRLIIAALSYPPTLERARDGKLHGRWLRSDNIALVEAAANMLQQRSVDVARSAVAEALAESSLPPETRTYLVAFDQRLAVMREKTL